MPLYSLVPSFRPLLAPVSRLRLRTDTHTHTQTHTEDNYRNPPAHARRGLIIASEASFLVFSMRGFFYIYNCERSELSGLFNARIFYIIIIIYVRRAVNVLKCFYMYLNIRPMRYSAMQL